MFLLTVILQMHVRPCKIFILFTDEKGVEDTGKPWDPALWSSISPLGKWRN